MQDLEAQLRETTDTLNVLSYVSQVLEERQAKGTAEAAALARAGRWLNEFAGAVHQRNGELHAQVVVSRAAAARAETEAKPEPKA